jgi:predicted transcriptional regulator
VGHEEDGRAFVYIPLVDRNQARKSALSQLLSKFFDDSPETLVLNLLGHERIAADELGRMRDLLDRASRAQRDRTNARKKAR